MVVLQGCHYNHLTSNVFYGQHKWCRFIFGSGFQQMPCKLLPKKESPFDLPFSSSTVSDSDS
jgi:hypothetical protein